MVKVCVCMYVYMYVCMHIYICICVHLYIYIYIYTCMYAYVLERDVGIQDQSSLKIKAVQKHVKHIPNPFACLSKSVQKQVKHCSCLINAFGMHDEPF